MVCEVHLGGPGELRERGGDAPMVAGRDAEFAVTADLDELDHRGPFNGFTGKWFLSGNFT